TNGANTYTTTNGYDSRSNLVWQVNAEGNPTRWTYDGLSRMKVKDVALTVGSPITSFTTYIRTQWAYDKNDRLTSHKDDAANETTWAYDALDRATTMTYPDSTTVAYTYDAEDNVTQTIDAIGNDIDDTYDSLNRRTARSVTRATGVLDTTSESFAYDAADRLTSAEDNDYKVEFTYGVLGLGSNVYEEKQQYATGTAYLKTVTKKYDAVGNKTSEVYPSSLALTYTWTDVNQVDTITDGTNMLADYAYAGLRRKQLVLGNNSQTHFTYGGFRGEVTTIDHQENSGNSLLKLDYGYNKLHDRTFERYGSSGQPGDAFEYDKARRLTVAWMGSSTPSSPSGNTYVNKIQYGMDDDGNRTTVTVTPYGSSPVNTSYTDNNLNQYTAVGGVSRSHDGNGNVSDDGTYLYEYNYRNLICRVKLKSNSSTVAEYRYDALGRRVEKVVTGATYRYIYSGVETVSVYTSTGTWKQDYVFGSSIDEVLMLEQADVLDWDGDSNTSEVARSWYRANALGSILRVEEPDRTEAVSYRYDPYGEVTITRGGASQSGDPLGQYVTYTGRWRDEETGLYHYRARVYDPLRGRFLQRDLLEPSHDASLYSYARLQATGFRDPMGLDGERVPPASGPMPGSHDTPGEHQQEGAKPPTFMHGRNFAWRTDLYFWGPENARGLWVRSKVTVQLSNLRKAPDGTAVPAPQPKVTVEYWRVGEAGNRTIMPDTQKDMWSKDDDFCAGTITVTMDLQFGTLKVKDPKSGEWGDPQKHYKHTSATGHKANHVYESTVGYTPDGSDPVYGSANVRFGAVGPSTVWTYDITWDTCPTPCSSGKWSEAKRSRLRDVTPPPPAPPARPPGPVTPSE
ncbi:MAG: RHS repeat-associated core domain-containing protein, partial [Planctomycetia bacterium]